MTDEKREYYYSTRELNSYMDDFTISPDNYDSLSDEWVPKACDLAHTAFRNHEKRKEMKNFANNRAKWEFYKSILFAFAVQYDKANSEAIWSEKLKKKPKEIVPIQSRFMIRTKTQKERKELVAFLKEEGFERQDTDVELEAQFIKSKFPIVINVASMEYTQIYNVTGAAYLSSKGLLKPIEYFYENYRKPECTFEEYKTKVEKLFANSGYTKEQVERYLSKRMQYLFLNYEDYITGIRDAKPEIVAYALDVVIRPQRRLEDITNYYNEGNYEEACNVLSYGSDTIYYECEADCFYLDYGQRYYAGLFTIRDDSPERDIHLGFHFIKQAYDYGVPISHYEIAKLYDSLVKTSEGRAEYRDYIEYRFDKGEGDFAIVIADEYRAGIIYPKNIEDAIVYYEAAAKHGIHMGYDCLGELYFKGEEVEQDYEKAYQYFTSYNGYESFTKIYCLGVLYQQGICVPQDLEKAAELFRMIVDNDSEYAKEDDYYKPAKKQLKITEKMMTEEGLSLEDYKVLVYRYLIESSWQYSSERAIEIIRKNEDYIINCYKNKTSVSDCAVEIGYACG